MREEQINEAVFLQRKEAVLAAVAHPQYQPMKIKELAILLSVGRDERKEFSRVLDSLVKEGKISISARGKYGRAGQFTNRGVFDCTKGGFGFINTGVEGEEDIFVAKEDTLNAFSGDVVTYVLLEESSASARRQRGGRRRGRGNPVQSGGGKHIRGRITGIVEHATSRLVGRVDMCRGFAFIIPDNPKYSHDIFVEQPQLMGAKDGDKVVVQLTEYPEQAGKNPVGEVVEVLGHADTPGTDILSVAKSYNIPIDFPDEALAEAAEVPSEVSESELAEELRGGRRRDLRGWLTITIDGEDAKDLDDAITLEALENGNYRLGVHIADVSHYVREGSALDAEALRRGTSCYLTDRVIPMLPKALSNGICSLNEHCDRLTLSCIMEIDAKGQLTAHEIVPAVIRVDHRMTYTDVNLLITGQADEALRVRYQDILEMLSECAALSDRLRRRRGSRGALDFDFPEAKIILNEDGAVQDIKPYEHNRATRLIEDFMLCANETVAEDFYWQDAPFLYRVHPEPDGDHMKAFSSFIQHFGYSLHTGNGTVHPKELQKLLSELDGSPYEGLISRVLLRSMQKAKYSTSNSGHFGLSAQYYTHFTSPIRRYPDLQIHRIIKESLKGGLNEARRQHYYGLLDSVAEQSSRTEVRAAETERAVVKMKKAQYMSERIGQRYEGVVSGVTSWGFYVELPNTVEGLVRLADLHDDYYTADTEQYQVVGTRSGRRFMLGQTVAVVVTNADLYLNTIDFGICEDKG